MRLSDSAIGNIAMVGKIMNFYVVYVVLLLTCIVILYVYVDIRDIDERLA